MSQRRTAEPDCSAVVAFSSLCQNIVFPINEILVHSAWSILQISSWSVSRQRGKSCGSSDQMPFSWPALTVSIFLCLLSCVFSLARLTQIKTLAKIREFAVSHGVAFLSSFFRLELELIISVYSSSCQTSAFQLSKWASCRTPANLSCPVHSTPTLLGPAVTPTGLEGLTLMLCALGHRHLVQPVWKTRALKNRPSVSDFQQCFSYKCPLLAGTNVPSEVLRNNAV